MGENNTNANELLATR